MERLTLNSEAGVLVDRMVRLVGEGDKSKGWDFFMARGKPMTDIGFYTGLRFHWRRETMTKNNGEEVTLLMPVEYLGEVAR